MIYKSCLKEERIKKRYSIDQLSKKSGISKSHISRIENYERIPSVCVAYALARALSIHVNDLFQC